MSSLSIYHLLPCRLDGLLPRCNSGLLKVDRRDCILSHWCRLVAQRCVVIESGEDLPRGKVLLSEQYIA